VVIHLNVANNPQYIITPLAGDSTRRPCTVKRTNKRVSLHNRLQLLPRQPIVISLAAQSEYFAGVLFDYLIVYDAGRLWDKIATHCVITVHTPARGVSEKSQNICCVRSRTSPESLVFFFTFFLGAYVSFAGFSSSAKGNCFFWSQAQQAGPSLDRPFFLTA